MEEAEVWGIYYGLKLAWEKGFRSIIIESDSRRVVDWLTNNNGHVRTRGVIANIITRCKDMMQRDWVIKVSHIFREHNRVADQLAKKAFIYERGLRAFDHLPSDIREWLELDAKGAPMARRIEINRH